MPIRLLPRAIGLPLITLAVTLAGCTSSAQPNPPTPVFNSVDAAPGTPGMPGMGSGMPGMNSDRPTQHSPDVPAGSAPRPPAGADTISISDFTFSPKSFTVPVGTTVTWTNNDEEPHSVVAPDGTFHSPTLGTGGTYSFTFTKAGTFEYICGIHPFMTATVVVTR